MTEQERDEAIKQRTKDKFMALPDFYKSSDGIKRYTNVDDAIGSVSQEDLIAIARALRDGIMETAGERLKAALMRVLERQAEDEIDEEDA